MSAAAWRGLVRGLTIGVLVGLLLGCTGPRPEAGDGKRSAPAASAAKSRGAGRSGKAPASLPDLAGIEREVLARVNRFRKSEGLSALATDTRVAEIARDHSRAMAAGRTGFGHGGFKGRTRAVASKLPYKRVAENISRHLRDPREIPAVAVERWIDSRGHRRNIEGPFAVTGVGAALGPDGSVYLTQLFVAPR